MSAKIAAAFVKAQKGFGAALKTSTNPHFKSRYADLSACVEAVIDSLNDNGIGLMQNFHESEGGVTVETVFIHESGDTLSGGKLFVPATKQDAQGFGSAITYGRRYGLMAACGIAPEDDDGNAAAEPKKRVLPDGVVADHLAAISCASTVDDLKKYYESAFKAANSINDTAAIQLFVSAKDKRKNELLPDIPQ